MRMTPDTNPAGRSERAARLLHRAAAVGVALTFAVIVASAWLRLAQAGLGCVDWPTCYGAAVMGKVEQPSLLFASMRIMHRIAASAVAFLVIVIAAVGLGRMRRELGCARLAGVIIALTLFLAVLGTVTPGAQLPAVTLGNLVGGMALLAAMEWLRLVTREAPCRTRFAASPALTLGIALLALQLTLGALVSATYAGASCPSFPGCSGAWEMSGATASLLDPWRLPAAAQGAALIDDPARAGLQMLHRFNGAVLAIYWCGVALVAIRRRTRAAASASWAAAVLLAECALGAAAVMSGLPLWLAVAHNAGAALAVLAVTGTVFQSRFSDEARVSAACQMVISK
jgi:cytochrome c oxidase assembly protein subunit 15